MRIVHVIATVDPKFGGPPQVAVQLSAAQAGQGHDVSLVAYPQEEGMTKLPEVYDWVPGSHLVRMVMMPRERGLGHLWLGQGVAKLEHVISQADVVHLHGVWEPLVWMAAKLAKRHGVPYVVRPAGMLDPWSLSQRWLKKRVALFMGFRRMLEDAAFIHALNQDERDLVSLLGLRCGVEVVPNGMFLESLARAPDQGTFRRAYPKLGQDPYILFLSRLHFKKGLDYLADAFQSVANRIPNVKLVVAGPDEGALDGFSKKVFQYGLKDRVLMPGPLYGDMKYAALRDATVFCLPSRQEGFSVAVIEALAVGLPVVISEPCHFPEVADAGAGLVVPLNSRAVSEGLLRVLRDPKLQESMSGKASALVRENYTWPKISARCVELYEKAQNGTLKAAGRSESKLRILHVTKSLDPSMGGPPMIAARLAAAQAGLGHEVHMLSYRVEGADNDVRAAISQIPHGNLVEHHFLMPAQGLEPLLATQAARVAKTLARRFDVVHMHGIWEPMLLRVAREARKAETSYVVTPHGMLDPWSLSQRTAKKKLALAIGVRMMINRAMFMHLGNRDERELIGPLKLTARHELIPNGVFEEEVSVLPPRGTFRASQSELGDRPYILFLSRLHFKKGLDYLADAFTLLAARLPNVDLVVAGPDGGAKADFEQRIKTAKLESRVHLVGPIYGDMKLAAVVDSACFCLPSRQEGFSMAITEALGCGVPCVVSKACHYPEVAESGAGYVTELDPKEIADALYAVVSNPEAAKKMGKAGRELVLTRFTWPVIAKLACEHYVKHMPPKDLESLIKDATQI